MAKTFGKKLAEKGKELIEGIKTPANKAATGNIADTVKNVIKDQEMVKVLQYIGTIFFDGKKLQGNNVSAMLNNISSPSANVLTKMRTSLDTISKSVTTLTTTITGAYNAAEESSKEPTDFVLGIDLTKAENLDKFIDAMSKVKDEDIQNFAKLFDAANKISFIDMKDLETNFIAPLNKLSELQFQDISDKINGIMDSDLIGSLREMMDNFNTLPEVGEEAENAFKTLDSFMGSMVKLSGVDINDLSDATDKFDIMRTIISGEETNNLKDIIKNLSEITDTVPDSLPQSLENMAIVFGRIAQMTSVLGKSDTKEMLTALDNADKITNKLKTMTPFTEEDANKLSESTKRMETAITDFNNTNEKLYEQLEKTAKDSEKSKKHVDKIVGATKKTNAATEELAEEAEEQKKNKTAMSIDGIGDTILKVGAVMLIGTMILTKNPDMMKQTIKFGATLAIFIACTVTPLVLLGVIAGKLKASGNTIDELGTTIIKLAGVLAICTFVYAKMAQKGLDASDAAKRFTHDLMMLCIQVVGILAIASIITRDAEAVNALGTTVMKLALVMIIGAMFMKKDKFDKAKNALLFGAVLMAFIFLIALPLRFITKGGIFSNSAEAIGDVGRFVVISATVMLIGALFMLIKNGKLALLGLAFGATLALFILMLIIPLKLITGGVFKGITTKMCIEQLVDFVKTASIILMIGGIYMTLFGGRLAKGALAFAILLSAFILVTTLAIKILISGMAAGKPRMIKRFKETIEVIALVLMVGGLLMMVPGFSKRALQFAALMSIFTLSMALIFIVVGKTMRGGARKSIFLFSLAVFAIIAVVTWSVLALKDVNWKQFLKAIGFVALTMIIFAGIFYLIGSEKFALRVAIGALVMLAISLTMILFSIVLTIISKALETLTIKDVIILGLIMAGLVAIFYLIGTPEVAFFVAIGAAIILMISVAMLIMASVFLLIHYMVTNFDLEKDLEKLLSAVANQGILYLKLSLLLGPIILASISITLMAASMTALAIGFLLVHVAALFDIEKDAKKLTKGIYALLNVYTWLGFLMPFMVLGSIAAAFIGTSLIFLGIGFGVLHIISLFNAVKDAKKVSKSLYALMGVYTYLGLLMPLIVFGSVAATSLGASLIVVGLGFGALHLCASKLKEKDIDIIDKGLRKIKNTYVILGLLTPLILLGSISATLLSSTLLLINLAFGVLHAVVDGKDLVGDVTVLHNAIKASFPMFKDLLKHTFSIALGGTVGIALGTAISLIGLAFSILHNTVVDSPDLSSEIDTFGDNLVKCINIFSEKMSDIDFKKVFANMLLVKWTMKPLIKVASDLFLVIKDFATLMIPDKWNKEDGTPIHWTQLQPNDFKNAAESISLVFETLIGGIAGLLDNPKIAPLVEDFKGSGEASGFLGKLFKSGTSKFSILIRMASAVTRLVGESGDAIAKMACLMVPIKWNNDGVAIKYRTLQTQDFTTAAEGVKTIMTTMIGAVNDVANDGTYSKLIKDFLEDGGESPFAGIINMSRGISEMLSDMAQGIADFANLRIPVKWGSDGKPKKWITVGNEEFAKVGENIDSILGCLVTAVKDAYTTYFGPSNNSSGSRKGRREARRQAETAAAQGDAMAAIMCAVGDAVELVANTAKVIADIANLRIPKYKEGSLTITGYENITPEHFTKMAEMVKTILTEIPKAILDGWKTNPFSAYMLEDIMDAIMPMTDFLANLVQCMKDYASMSEIPILDKDGNVIDHKPFDYDKVLGGMGDNVEKLMTGMFTALQKGYSGFSEEVQKNPDLLGDMIDAITPIGTLMKDLMEVTINYANLKVPHYNKKGEIDGYYTIIDNPDQMDKLFGSIETNIQTILSGLIDAVSNALSGYMTKEGMAELEKIAEAAEQVKEIIAPVNDIVELVKNYSELKFPTGYGKDGKVKGYQTAEEFDFTKMQVSLTSMISAFPKAVRLAIVKSSYYMKKMFEGEDDNDSLAVFKDRMVEISTMLKDVVYPMINGFANLKIPTGFDKDGKPKGYMQLNSSEFNKLSDNVKSMVESIPKAITTVLDEIDFSDETLHKLENLISMVDKAEELIGYMYSEEKMNEINDYSSRSIKFMMHFANISATTNAIYDSLNKHIFIDIIKILSFVDKMFSDSGKFNDSFRETMVDVIKDVMSNLSTLVDVCSFDETDKSKNLFKKSNDTIKDKIKKLELIDEMLFNVISVSNSLVKVHAIAKNLTTYPFTKLNRAMMSLLHSRIFFIPVIQLMLAKKKFDIFNDISNLAANTAVGLNIVDKSMNSIDDDLESFGKLDWISFILVNSPILNRFNDDDTLRNAINFNFVTSLLVNAVYDLKKFDREIISIHDESFLRFSWMMSQINESMETIEDENVEKLDEEANVLNKYVKTINSIQLGKIMQLNNLFTNMNKLANSFGDLKEFTQVLANEIGVALVDLTDQIGEAKKVITTAERQRDKRQEALDRSIERIEKLMSKPLNVNVSSGNDKLGAAYENPQD